MVILQSGSSGIDSWNYPEHPILITINMGQALLISMFFQYKMLISEPLVLFFYIDLFAGFEKQYKNQYKNQYFSNVSTCLPFPFWTPDIAAPAPSFGGLYAQISWQRIRTLSQGLAPSLPFSRDVLSQGMPFLKGLWQLTLLQGFSPFARISAGIFPFPKGCPRAPGLRWQCPFARGFLLH